MKRILCIGLHDVAPATWPACEILLAMLERLGTPPVTLLVVPHFHRGERVDRAPRFMRAIDACVAAGAEVALHGYSHLDESPAPTTLGAWVRRRVLTQAEGEFAALPRDEAAARIEHGLHMLRQCGWPVSGFVPPAWLSSQGTCEALKHAPLAYFTSYRLLYRLTDGTPIAAPCITASARSPLRRLCSQLWLRAMQAATADTAILRVALHPVDAGSPAMLAHWEKLIRALLAERTALTKQQAIEHYAGSVSGRVFNAH